MISTPMIAQPTPAAPDLCALWEWPYDDDFVDRLRRECARQNKTFADYSGERTADFFRDLAPRGAPPGMIIDRASDDQPRLVIPLLRLKQQGALLVNDPEDMAWCRNKAAVHAELLQAGVRVPYSVILSTAEHPEALDVLELVGDRLGDPFVIKPTEGGGGENVVLNAHGRQDVSAYLARTGEDRIFVQRKVLPCRLGGKRAWFRVFRVLSRVIPCWWDDLTHVYQIVTDEEQGDHALQRLAEIVGLIARVSRLDLFSTEIAVDEDGRCVVVDAVNEMPDFRLQSRHPDGVPDAVVDLIVAILVAGVPEGASRARRFAGG